MKLQGGAAIMSSKTYREDTLNRGRKDGWKLKMNARGRVGLEGYHYKVKYRARPINGQNPEVTFF